MFASGGTAVARPKKDDGEARTKHVRINGDLARMLGEVLDALGGSPEWTSARFLDPHIRGPIQRAHKQHEELIQKLKRSRAKAKKQQGSEHPGE